MRTVHLNTLIRRETLRCLRGRWGKAVAGTLFLAGLWLLIVLLEQLCLTGLTLVEPAVLKIPLLEVSVSPAQAVLSGFFALVSFLVLAPLKMGLKKWYYRLSAGPTPDLRMIFDYLSSFRLYGKAIWLQIVIGVRVAFFGALLSLIPTGLWIAQRIVRSFSTPVSAVGQAALLLLMVLTSVLSGLLLISFSLRYFLAVYCMAADESLSVRQAVRQSVQAMKGKKGQVLTLMLSWLPLLIPCLLLVPALFVLPSCSCALAINARYLLGRAVYAGEETRQDPAEEGVSAKTAVF